MALLTLHYVCSGTDHPSRNIRFIIIDQSNNTNSLSTVDTDNLLLQKERFWISTLVTIHKGHMIGIENVVQNAVSKGRTYDN